MDRNVWIETPWSMDRNVWIETPDNVFLYIPTSVMDIGYRYDTISTSNKANILNIGPGHGRA